ncbi:hypothetical protein ACFT4A_09195 [Streptomyces sp. NPDC057099]|uniref:hypothetical protein n=1 Tax=Streptomyces sp. NPDC057099 TaxID=3346019 RepID=UPI00363261E5
MSSSSAPADGIFSKLVFHLLEFQIGGIVSSTYAYRFRGSRGGLAADLTAESGAPADGDAHLQIERNVCLTLPPGVNWRDAAWLSFGLAVHAPELVSRHPEGLCVRVTSLVFPHAYFRSEVAALVMDGWLRQEFDLPDRELSVAFDAAGDTYRFQWGEHKEPFSDDLVH